jgi:hypothetical protein
MLFSNELQWESPGAKSGQAVPPVSHSTDQHFKNNKL